MARKKSTAASKKIGTVKTPTVKAEPVKAEPVKTSEEVKEPVKMEIKKEIAENVPAKRELAKETKTEERSVKKTLVKKTPAKNVMKKAPAKKDIKVKAIVEYYGKQVEEKDMIANVKKAWTKAYGKKVGDIKSIDIYIKPEEGAVYYVVNGTDTGAVAF